jgi:hypothetical protein
MAIMFWFMRTQTEGIIINRGNQYCLGNENSKDQRDLKENENRILVWLLPLDIQYRCVTTSSYNRY